MSNLNWEWYWPSLNVRLGIQPDVYHFLALQNQLTGDNECGGQLFMDMTDPKGLKIIAATPPHANDKAGPSWLELDEIRCREEIVTFNASGHRLIGYWHTHPQEVPEISSQDIDSFKRFSKQNHAHLPNPIAIIVGRALSLDGVRIWSFQGLLPIMGEINAFTN